jgi:hypothetical protein
MLLMTILLKPKLKLKPLM